jgi:hypothetical protein
MMRIRVSTVFLNGAPDSSYVSCHMKSPVSSVGEGQGVITYAHVDIMKKNNNKVLINLNKLKQIFKKDIIMQHATYRIYKF